MIFFSFCKKQMSLLSTWHSISNSISGNEWDDRKDIGWKERMDDWKLMQQGNLGPEQDDVNDSDMGM